MPSCKPVSQKTVLHDKGVNAETAFFLAKIKNRNYIVN